MKKAAALLAAAVLFCPIAHAQSISDQELAYRTMECSVRHVALQRVGVNMVNFPAGYKEGLAEKVMATMDMPPEWLNHLNFERFMVEHFDASVGGYDFAVYLAMNTSHLVYRHDCIGNPGLYLSGNLLVDFNRAPSNLDEWFQGISEYADQKENRATAQAEK